MKPTQLIKLFNNSLSLNAILKCNTQRDTIYVFIYSKLLDQLLLHYPLFANQGMMNHLKWNLTDHYICPVTKNMVFRFSLVMFIYN